MRWGTAPPRKAAAAESSLSMSTAPALGVVERNEILIGNAVRFHDGSDEVLESGARHPDHDPFPGEVRNPVHHSCRRGAMKVATFGARVMTAWTG